MIGKWWTITESNRLGGVLSHSHLTKAMALYFISQKHLSFRRPWVLFYFSVFHVYK